MRVGLAVDMAIHHFRQALRGVAEYNRAHKNWDLLRAEGTVRGLQILLDLGVDAILLGTVEKEAGDFASTLVSLPLVSLGSPHEQPGLVVVAHDERAVADLAASYFDSKKFVHVACAGLTGKPVQDLRVENFRRLMLSRGRECPIFSESGYLSRSRGVEPAGPTAPDQGMTEWLQSLEKPVAIFCDCDERSWLVAEHSKRLGLKVPDEVAILGVDNDETVCFLPDAPLSTVLLASQHEGYRAAELLEEWISSKRPRVTRIDVPPLRVIERRSTDITLAPDPIVRRALEFMRAHIAKSMGIDELARELGCSRRNFERKFHQLLDVSPASMWMRFRVDEARRLLAETDLTIEIIAGLCGFSDSRGLSMNFRKATGLTPSEFRKRSHPTHAPSGKSQKH